MTRKAPSPFRISHLDEPDIEFAGGQAKSPKRGLFRHGPRLKGGGESYVINLGIVGDRDSIDRMTMLLSDMEFAVVPEQSGMDNSGSPEDESTSSSLEGHESDAFAENLFEGIPEDEEIHEQSEKPDITPSHIPFPGLVESDNLNVSMNVNRNWQLVFDDRRIQNVVDKPTMKAKIEKFLKRIEKKIRTLSNLSHGPEVVMVCIPEIIQEECTSEGEKYANVGIEGLDLHDQVKIQGMKNNLPTQVINNQTLYHDNKAKKASKAYNLTAGMLYKAQDGHPWKTRDMREGVCYAGIVFYNRDEGRGREPNTHAALAHVFTKRGHNILQSGPLKDIEEDDNNQPHLSHEAAEGTIEEVVSFYKELNKGMTPRRLVLHKTSEYWPAERQGFLAGSPGVGIHDFVTIGTDTNLRLYPSGQYPAMRGTLLSVPEDDVHYLYTVGYAPAMATWEGTGVPGPIKIEPDEESCRTSGPELAEEIMFLTKLDWNTTEFAVKMPITIKAGRKVATVLSEVDEEDIDDLAIKYLYYM